VAGSEPEKRERAATLAPLSHARGDTNRVRRRAARVPFLPRSRQKAANSGLLGRPWLSTPFAVLLRMQSVVIHCAQRFALRLAWISLAFGALLAAAS
jgi:hypothetical protein